MGDFDSVDGDYYESDEEALSPGDCSSESEEALTPNLNSTDSPDDSGDEEEYLTNSSCVGIDEQLFDAELDMDDAYSFDYRKAAESMRHRAQRRPKAQLSEREKMMRAMRLTFNASQSFGGTDVEEEFFDRFGRINVRAVKRSWLRGLYGVKTCPPSNLCIIRTCVTEPGVEEVLVHFTLSQEAI